jgi:hypothetical protein
LSDGWDTIQCKRGDRAAPLVKRSLSTSLPGTAPAQAARARPCGKGGGDGAVPPSPGSCGSRIIEGVPANVFHNQKKRMVSPDVPAYIRELVSFPAPTDAIALPGILVYQYSCINTGVSCYAIAAALTITISSLIFFPSLTVFLSKTMSPTTFTPFFSSAFLIISIVSPASLPQVA